jgi:hypothetical protein
MKIVMAASLGIESMRKSAKAKWRRNGVIGEEMKAKIFGENQW